MKNVENKSSAKPLIVVIISVLVIVILGIVIAYAVNQGELVKEKDGKIGELQKKVNTLTDYVEQFQASVNQQVQTITEQEENSITYTNDVYGFNLTLPSNWVNYKTEERALNLGNNRIANSIDFYFDENEVIFNVGVIEKTIWDTVKDLSYYQATKLGENDQYVFGYVVPAKVDTGLVESLELDLEKIKASFQILQIEINKVTWVGGGFTQDIEADPETFTELSDYYAKDKDYVYYADCIVGGCTIIKLENVDVDTFMVFEDSEYTKDKNYIYKGGQILEDADLETFEVMNQRYAKDKNHVYEYGIILEVVDPETFNPENF